MITAVVPVYNAATTLRRCLDSVLAQGWKLVIVNDGSTDGSGAICDEYQDRATVIHTNNYGPAHARNVGLDVVTTDEVTFVDADDYVDGVNELITSKNYIEVMTQQYLDKPYSATDMADCHGKIFYTATSHRFNESMRLLEDVDFMYRYLYSWRNVKFFDGYIHTNPNASMKAYRGQQNMIEQALRSIQRFMPQGSIGHAYGCLTIVHLVRACRKLSWESRFHVYEAINDLNRELFSEYKRGHGHSIIIPWLLWLRMPFLLMLACHWRARSRYG